MESQHTHKYMKRPSMSEYNDSITKDKQRSEKALGFQYDYVDKIAKMQLHDHDKKRKSFLNSQFSKLSSVPRSRRSLDDGPSSASADKSESFQQLSTLSPQSHRGSLPIFLPSHPSLLKPMPRIKSRKLSVPGKITVWDELSSSKWSNRQLEIRQRLYDEFNVPSNSKPGPWSPRDRNTPNQGRRSSHPTLYLHESLKEQVEERMAAFLGKKNLAGRTIDEDTTPSTAYPSQMNTSEVDEVKKIKGQTVSFAEPVITMMRQRHSGVPAIGSSHTTTTSLMNATRRHSETIGPSNTPERTKTAYSASSSLSMELKNELIALENKRAARLLSADALPLPEVTD